MAQGAFEGGVVSIRGDASQVKEELLEVSKLLTELEKNKVKLKPEIDINNVKKDINKLEQYMQGKFGALDFSQVYSKLIDQMQKDPNKFAEKLAKTMHGVNLLEQAVKPEDISKLAAASAEEIFDLVKRLGGLAEGTKPTSNLVTKRLKEIYDKYPNGVEGLGGSGKGGGFGASEEALNKIGETLERIDVNVKSINDSIQTGEITIQAVAKSADDVVDKTKQAADAQAELTTETEKTAQAQERLEQIQDKNNEQRQNTIDKKESGKETEKGDSKKGTGSTFSPISNTKSLNDTIKKEEELKQVTEKTNETLKNQQSLKTVSYQDIMSKSISDVASNASKVLQNLKESQKELGNDIQTTTNLLKTQNTQIQDTNNKPIIENTATEINTQQIMLDVFSESAKKAGEIGQKLGQQQNLLANAFQKTTEQIAHQSMFDTFIDGAKQATEALQQLGQQQDKLLSEAFKASQKTNKEYNPKEIIERVGDVDQIQKYVYSVDEAEAKLKEIKSRHANKKDEAKQLDSSEAREVWGALNSLDQISLFGSDEEVERVNQIFDQYEEWVERYVTQDPLGTNALDKMSALFERMNKYRSAFDKANTLDQSRELYNLDIGQRSAIMTPDQTIEGYSYALDRVKIILETMEQYKTAIEEAQAKGQEITEEDQKFLDNYDKTKTQWMRASERAQTNLNSLQEQKRLAEEDKKRIEQRKQDEKERRILRNQLQREDRQTRIKDDQQFETAFQEYKIGDIKNMGLDEIEKRITQMEESKKKAEELRNELIQLKKNIKANDSYKEGKLDEEVIDAMRPTEQEEEWLALYDEQAKKRKEYAQKLKKQKNEIKKKQEEEVKAEAAKSQTDEDTKQAQNNADQAQEAADKAKKAADESEDAVKRANDAQKRNEKENTEKEDKKPVTESISANQTAQKNVKYVTRTKEQLQAQLTMAEQSVVNYKEKQEQLQKEIESIQNKTFDVNGQEWGNAKTAEEFLANKLIEDNAELEKVNANLTKKENSVKNLSGRIKQIESWEEQGFDIQLKEKSPKTTVKKKIAIAGSISGKTAQASSSDTINIQIEEEKKDGEAVNKLKDETQNTNNKLQETKELTDEQNQLLDALFNGDNKKGSSDNSGLGNEDNSFTSLIESLKNLPAVTKILSEFDAVNSNISKNAQGAADAIQAEANAFSSMTQATQGMDDHTLIPNNKDDKKTPITEKSQDIKADAEKEIEQAQTIDQQIKAKIESIRAGLKVAEDELQEYSLEDSRFNVGKNKTKGYSQAKLFADQLKADYEALQSVDKEANPEEYKAKLNQYTKSRVLFQKAYQAMWDAGGAPASKDKPTKKNPITPLQQLIDLMKQHGAQSPDFEQVLQDFERQAQEAREKFEKQKAETEKIIQDLEQEKIKVDLEQKQTPSQPKPTAETKPVEEKPDLGGSQTGNGIKNEGDEATNAAAKMKELAAAKKEVTEANQKLAQSAQNTTGTLNNEGSAGANVGKAFDPKPLQDQIDAQKKTLEEQKKLIEEQKKSIEELKKTKEELLKNQSDDSILKVEPTKEKNPTKKEDKEEQKKAKTQSSKQTEQYKTVLSGLEKQIEDIQKNSKKLINPDDKYKSKLENAKELLSTIQQLIAELNANPLQFMGKDGVDKAKALQSSIDRFKDETDILQDDYQSQKGIQGRINTYLTSYKGAYTSFFREIKDSFKSQALGELQKEIDRTFTTFEDSIVNLNRATGLNQGEFLDKYLNTNGGKATAGQIEQQQKVRNAIAENYRGLITDISDELVKAQDKMSNVLGKDFLNKDFFQEKFGEQFTSGLGDTKKFVEFQNNAQKARESLVELQKIQKQMADGELDLTQLAPDKLKNKIQEIVKLFADLNVNYEKVADSAKDFTFADIGDIEKQRAKITQFLENNRGISSKAQVDLRSYFDQLQQGISQADLTKLTDGWHQVADAEQAAGRTGATFMSELQTRFRSLSTYLLSFVSFYEIIGTFKQGIGIIHELDDALTEMQKVSDESLSSLKEYQKTTFDTANNIGTTAQQLQVSTADWMRLGETLQEASQSAQTANVLFNVSEFESIDEATTALVAMSAAYADAEKDIDKMDIVDRLNLIGNNYAIATDELATALQDGAATLQTAGNDLDQAIALTTAGNEKIA